VSRMLKGHDAEASAPGKVILLGEHAVVHGRPAIAAPVRDVRAQARVRGAPLGQGCWIVAQDVGREYALDTTYGDEWALPLQTTVRNTLTLFDVARLDVTITVRSDVPFARGMGSGPAVASSIVRALAAYLGRDISAEEVSQLVYQTEVLLHGTPSGIDNAVVAHERPVYFCRGQPMEFVRVGAPLTLVIADTGIPSRTRDAIDRVRQGLQGESDRFNALFDSIAVAVDTARDALETGDAPLLGRTMDTNGDLLEDLGVSCPELDRMVGLAREAGALGAKLSGGGLGGCMIALAPGGDQGAGVGEAIAAALRKGGAARVMSTHIAAR